MGRRQDINNRMFLRPSPNEEKKLLQDEKEKLRKLRLQQVRQQEKVLASKARRKFKEKEKKEIDILETELKKKWEEDITARRSMLENKYYENVAHVGEGHQAALVCDDGAPKERSLEDEIRASERYREALTKLREDDAEKAQTINEKTEAKNKAMEMERVRAARVAALDPPVPDIAQNLEAIQRHRYKQKNIEEYSSTYYHLPRERAERADPHLHQVDARHAASEEEERLQLAKEESDRNFSEQMEKARLRHKHARSKLLLEKDHNKLLDELEHFERMDRQRRQEIVSQIPKHVFEPPHRRIEGNEERQREIEHAFENMYMAQSNYMGDVTVAQNSLPVSPAVTDEESLVEREEQTKTDIQVQSVEESGPNSKTVENPSRVGEGKRKFIEEAEKSRTDARPSSKDPLKRLLKKIDIQRGRWRSEMKTAKDIIADNESEISEGTLTMTTENARSVSVESDAGNDKRTTLLHPYEEAERSRAASKYIQIPDATRKIEIEKQREQLQQQKLKLQLQQQQVMQEHLQLQFDAINNEMEKDESESNGHITSDSHLQQSPRLDKDTEFPDLSSGVLSDDGRIESADEAGVNKSSHDDVSPDSSHTDDSRVDAVVDRHDAFHSIPESTSEDDFVLLPSVSTAAIVSGVSQPLPLKFINTTAATPAFTKNISSKITPPQPVSPAQYNTGLFSGQPPLNSPSNWQFSFHISPPHVAVPTVSHSEEPILSSQVPAPRLTHSVLQETTLHTVGPAKPPAADYLDNHEMSLRSKPPTDSEKTVSGVEHRRAPERAIIISDSTSPFFRMPSTVSSTPFLHEGPSTFQFPGDRETDTASYLHFYQQQLLEQQNRIREQQKAIQERQQQRLEQLKQFQERLRGHRHDTGSGKSAQTGDKISQSGGEWKSLIPSTRYFHDDNSSTSTDRAESERESVDRVLSVGIHRDVNPSLKLPQLRTSTTAKTEIPEGSVNGTSSSLKRFPSEVISIKDDNVSLVPKTSDLGLWSDSTPHLSSSDATKSSLSALNDCKTDRKLDDKPSHLTVRQEFRISGSSLSNSSNGIEITSSSRKSGSSFDSGPLSISSLPKSADRNISTGSSASDSNNNLLLQRMESSFQHFQEMIDEAKSLNKQYLGEARHSENADVEKRSSIENTENKDVAEGGDNIPRSEEFSMNNQANETSLGESEEDQGHSSSTCEVFHEQVSHREDQYLLENLSRGEERSRISEENESEMFSPSMISNQENLSMGVQQFENRMYEVQHEPMSSYYDSSPKALSVIPEETRVSDDDLSEGMLEEEDFNDFEIPTMASYTEQQTKAPLTRIAQINDYFTDIIRQGDDELQAHEEPGDFISSESRKSFSLPNDDMDEPTHTSPSYLPYRSPEQPTASPHNSEEMHRTHSDKMQYTPEMQSWEKLSPGGIMTSAEASKKFGLHVDLPRAEQLPYIDHSTGSSSLSMNDVVLSGLSSLSLSKTDESSTSGLSLQDAFRKSRPEFFRHSEERVLRAREARYRDSPVKKKQENDDDRHDPERTKHGATQGTSSIVSKPSSEKSVEKKLSDSGQKITKDEMKDRTKRLYENLPDVRQKVAEKQRQETYTANRLKAQEFQKKTRERLRKLSAKKTGKKT